MKIERYSKDRIILRILNTLSFTIFIFLNIYYLFLSKTKSTFIEKFLNKDVFLIPYKYYFYIWIIALFVMLVFIFAQIDSSSHGIKKRVIENLNYSVFLCFSGSSLALSFFNKNSLNLSILFLTIAYIFLIVAYVKSNLIKKYMYNDEIRVFVAPFSIYIGIFTDIYFTIININISNLGFKSTSLTLLAIFEILIIIFLSIITIYLFKDKLFYILQILFLVAIIVEKYIYNKIMPIGYICFLSVIAILFAHYKIYNKNKN